MGWSHHLEIYPWIQVQRWAMDPIINGGRIIPIYILPYKWVCLALQMHKKSPRLYVGSETPTLYPKKYRTDQQKHQSPESQRYSPWIIIGFFLIYTPFPWYDLDRDGLESEVARFETLSTWYRTKCWMLDVFFSHPFWFIYKLWGLGISVFLNLLRKD